MEGGIFAEQTFIFVRVFYPKNPILYVFNQYVE
jgi:hypothetical protein